MAQRIESKCPACGAEMTPSPSIQRAFRCPDCQTFVVDGHVIPTKQPDRKASASTDPSKH